MSAVVTLLAAVAVAAAAAPPLDVPLTVSAQETRDDGRLRRTFRVVRTVVLGRDGSGYVARVSVKSVEADAPPAERARYQAAYAGLTGPPLTVRLRADGEPWAVDALDAAWSRYVAALPTPGTGPGAAVVRAVVELPTARRIAILGSAVGELFAPPGDRVPVAERPVRLTGPPPYAALALTGTERIVRDGATLTATLAATGRAATGPALTLHHRRLIDPRYGLVTRSERHLSITGPRLRLQTASLTTVTW